MIMSEIIPYIKKNIGDSYLVWMENSNLFFLLEEPAWFVFERIANSHEFGVIAQEFSKAYSVGIDESTAFVNGMKQRINEYNQPPVFEDIPLDDEDKFSGFQYRLYSNHTYLMGKETVQFSFSDKQLENYIHPLIKHLEIGYTGQPVSSFELFNYQGTVVFRLNQEIKGVWSPDESHLVKGRIFLELINLLHNKKENDWLMTVHASAITNQQKTILFSAAPGSGKTTIAALLQARGYQLISDDFVPFDKKSLDAYPFPIAMSVKEGALEVLKSYYPQLEEKPLVNATPDKKVRYWPIQNEKMTMIYPVREIVFVKYDQDVKYRLLPLTKTQALKRLIDQIWVPPEPANIEMLFERIEGVSFYELVYSDTEKALNGVETLFEE